VDFPVFPRRHAKTEAWGVSVMDIGVGAFIVAAAMVSRQTRRAQARQHAGTALAGAQAPGGSQAADAGVSASARAGSSAAVRRRARSPARTPSSSGGTAAPTPPAGEAASHDTDAPAEGASPHGWRAVGEELWTGVRVLASTMVAVSPLLFLGTARLVVHTALNYQLHVTEYGVHWNFPYTSAAVALLAAGVDVSLSVASAVWAAVMGRRPPSPSNAVAAAAHIVAGLGIAAAYQAALEAPAPGWLFSWGATVPGHAAPTLQEYITHASRDTDFLAQNREGLAGVVGFFALYLCGVGVGRLAMDASLSSPRAWTRAFTAAAAATVAVWVAALVAIDVHGAVSRRMINLPYVLWVFAYSLTMMLAVAVPDIACCVYWPAPEAAPSADLVALSPAPAPWPRPPLEDGSQPGGAGRRRAMGGGCGAALLARALSVTPRLLHPILRALVSPTPLSPFTVDGGSVVLEAMSSNFLALFIVSNLLVGVPNHTMRTLDTPPHTAMVVLTAYMGAVVAIATAWRLAGLQLKFW
jgi:hypothetical protein